MWNHFDRPSVLFRVNIDIGTYRGHSSADVNIARGSNVGIKGAGFAPSDNH